MDENLECPCCGDDGAIGPVSDGQRLCCGCPGWVSLDADGDPWINNGDDECVACGYRAERDQLRKELAEACESLTRAQDALKGVETACSDVLRESQHSGVTGGGSPVFSNGEKAAIRTALREVLYRFRAILAGKGES